MEATAEQPRASIADYLQREQSATQKHEYRDGQIVAMAGGSPEHSLVVANVIGELRNRLKGKPCRVYESNLRVSASRSGLFTYPDATVVCGPLQRHRLDPSGYTIVNPTLIIEVLSPTTEAYDRGEKFNIFREIEGFREYVLVTTTTPRIETFFHQDDAVWLFSPFAGLSESAQLRSLGVALPLAEVYAGVEFPARQEPT